MPPGDDRVPVVSVVVATCNRAALLPRLVDALDAQLDAPRFELVLVDDGSTDGTAEVIEELRRSPKFPIRGLRQDRTRGPAAARNVGWRAAAAPLVAFTDDDCVPQPAWLAGLVAGLEHAVIALGPTTANPMQPSTGWFSWAPETSEDRGFYETCNIAYQRSALEKVGGFDERWQARDRPTRDDHPRYVAPAWGEDTDLALRVTATGGRAVFVTDALVWHDVKGGRLRDRLADLPRRGGVVRAVQHHPELRDRFESRWFTQRAHAHYLVAAAGLGVLAARPSSLPRWLLAAALSVPWVRARGAYYGRSAWPRVLPQWFLVDGVEIGVMAAASVRNRTLLL